MEWLKDIDIPADVIGIVVVSCFVIFLLIKYSFGYMIRFLDILSDLKDTLSELKSLIETLVPMIRDRLK